MAHGIEEFDAKVTVNGDFGWFDKPDGSRVRFVVEGVEQPKRYVGYPRAVPLSNNPRDWQF